MADGIMFSAGVDTSIIAYEATKYKPNLKALTIAFKHGKPRDTKYVKKMVAFLKLDHEFHVFDNDELVNAVERVVEILKTFDPMEVRNSTPIFIGLTVAKKKGIKSVFTGDGLDELFGYPWHFDLSEAELTKRLSEVMWSEMTFSSIPMGNSVGVSVKTPYLDPLFMDYAKAIPVRLKIHVENGVKYAKWLLRKAYEDLIPKEVIWRAKAPIEQGTGTEVLPTFFSKKFTDEQFEERKNLYFEEDAVRLSSKEQLFYYEFFRKRYGKPSEVYTDKSGKQCPNCKGYMKTQIGFCKICGSYPI
jgi:asparagine synthase (glutamine-hydrolysing)